jgi:hypothetical protein
MNPPGRVAWVLLAVSLSAAACSGDTQTGGGSPAPAAKAGAARRPAGSCGSGVTRAALPAWARTGFRGDGSGVPHVLGDHGDIIAVLFQYPPVAYRDPDKADKILWVSRLPQQPGHPLTIKATLDGSNTSVVRVLPDGAGPSGVNLPGAGCWRLSLHWSGHTDTMTLRFT